MSDDVPGTGGATGPTDMRFSGSSPWVGGLAPRNTDEYGEVSARLDTGVMLVGATGQRYRIVGRVGEGGFATVYVVQREDDSRILAAKVFRPTRPEELKTRPSAAGCMERERAALDVLRASPFFPTVFDTGISPKSDPFLVEEYFPGVTLKDAIDRAERLEPAIVLGIVDDLARGLVAAHRNRVVHRDLASQNIMLTLSMQSAGFPRIECRILDAGLAYVGDPGASGGGSIPLKTLALNFTPGYTAPERLKAADGGGIPPASHYNDYFSLGVVAFESLCGTLPFGRFTKADQIADGAQPAWPEDVVRNRAGQALRSLIDPLLQINPFLRPGNHDELSAMIDRVRPAMPPPSNHLLEWLTQAIEQRTAEIPLNAPVFRLFERGISDRPSSRVAPVEPESEALEPANDHAPPTPTPIGSEPSPRRPSSLPGLASICVGALAVAGLTLVGPLGAVFGALLGTGGLIAGAAAVSIDRVRVQRRSQALNDMRSTVERTLGTWVGSHSE